MVEQDQYYVQKTAFLILNVFDVHEKCITTVAWYIILFLLVNAAVAVLLDITTYLAH